VTDDQTLCKHCRKELAAKDWTCPTCGAIVARYLFSTVTLKSLHGESRNAYRSGYEACLNQAGQTGSSAIRAGTYFPSPGNETAYRAGWQASMDNLEAKADRKFGRRRGLRVLGSGVILLSLGLGIAYGASSATSDHFTLLEYTPIGLGALNVVVGIVMIITGNNDEARPS
jgi:hypothetical protein